MVRRTVLAIGIVCGASAAAAFTFASEISHAGSHLVERAVWRGRGVTAVPASGTSVHGDGRIAASPNETPRGEYCRFPPSRASVAAAAIRTDTLRGSSIGSTPLVLEGQSRIPDALPPELCTGDTVGTPRVPRLGKL
jgi:hypothetical protein